MKNFVLLASILLLAACGFHPVYGVNKYTDVGVEEHLAQVSISNIANREGQYLRNALIDRFYRNGRPATTKYVLNVEDVRESLINLDITKDSNTTRGQLRLDSNFNLVSKETGQVLMTRRLRSIASYNILGSEFATRVSEDNTRLNALEDMAAQIEQQLSLYFKRDMN